MLTSFLWILLAGFFAGQLTAKLKAPPLVGMIVCGLAIGPRGLNVLPPDFLAQAESLRTIAVMVILAKAGLGLDRNKLRQQGTVALRLGLLPAACETVVIAIAASPLFQFDLATGLLLGCVLAAESPAVIVPGMLFLKQKGWGVKKGIPDAILTGSALSDVLILLVFNLILSQLSQAQSTLSFGNVELNPTWFLPLQVIVQIVGGIGMGLIAAKILNLILNAKTWVQTLTQETLLTACIALLLVIGAIQLPLFSGYLAVMTLGLRMVEQNPPQARRLRQGFNSLWAIAQIILFVLLGASIQLEILEQSLIPGLCLLGIGTLLGRGLGWYLSTLGSNWTSQEKLYLLAGNSAKATVQAAIGAMPLAAGLPGGDIILALSALSILVTAPLGAWAIPFFGRRLLSHDEVDPTKVLRPYRFHVLVAVDTSPSVPAVLRYAAHLARCSDGSVSILHVWEDSSTQQEAPIPLRQQADQKMADIPHQWIFHQGEVADGILAIASDINADQIILGPASSPHGVVQTVLDRSTVPTLVVPAYSAK